MVGSDDGEQPLLLVLDHHHRTSSSPFRMLQDDNDANPWIEVDLVNSTVVSGVVTQGENYWVVTQYKVEYKKQPTSKWQNVTDGNGNTKLFIGNNQVELNAPVTNLFDESVVATVVRIVPTKRINGVALRLEFLGCRLG
ncbi:retinoschisin-like [Patiria miniata]|uniref:F5/8 type C domain-containing protein n=1 Tax=Patiria miniata TaxID=46514 RepID=A0A914AE22_PATMI|nr:retinoschisin-like [Patiria miniata]